jgi:hypothetical protein
MTMPSRPSRPSTPRRQRDEHDIERALAGLATEIDHLITNARPLRQLAWRDTDRQLAAYALDDMIHLLTEIKVRLHASTH